MTNLSKLKREELISFLEKIKQNNSDSGSVAMLNQVISALDEKKYGLVWEEHIENIDECLVKNIPIFKNIRDKEINNNIENKWNFLLEGDNLHSLHLLKKTHKEKIDVIYIDPPYNTKNKDFMYNDDYLAPDDVFKHSKWLSFMSKRLRIARELLCESGFIAISIDEKEFAQLKLLCDDIFGENNYQATIHIQVRYADKSLTEEKAFKPVIEYLLLYSKNNLYFVPNRPTEEYTDDKFVFEIKEIASGETIKVNNDEVTVFKKGEWEIIEHKESSKEKLKETWISGSIYTKMSYGKVFQAVVEPRINIDGLGSLYKVHGRGDDGLGYRYYTGPQRANAKRGKMYSGIPLDRLKEMELGEAIRYKPINTFYDLSADFGNIDHEGKVKFNSGKKPIKLLKEIINFSSNKNCLVLDFFAGSGSTGQAVLELNKDGNNRKFILCTNNENEICEKITYKRMENISEIYNFNLKYFKTDYVKKFSENEFLSDILSSHIIELIELNYGISIDNIIYQVVFSEKDIDKLLSNKELLNKCKFLFISEEVLLTGLQEDILSKTNIEIFDIPSYYFKEELREAGEIW